MTVGLLDLSIVTDQLLEYLRTARTNTRLWAEVPTPPIDPPDDDSPIPVGDTTPQMPFDIVFTGMAPDAARNLAGDCKISLYLFHITPERFYRNTFPTDPRDTTRAAQRPRQLPQQPLALTLFYLLSAHSESYIQEQQAMSIALKSLHEHAIVTATVPLDSRKQGFTITLEPQTIDEIGRLWQSISSPLRLSAVYRASVIFLEPEEPTKPIVKTVEPEGYSISAYPQFLVSRAIVSPTGLVTVWGRKFDDPSLEIRLDGTVLTPTTGAMAVGTVRIVDPTRLELQLASGTPKGILRLGVKVESEALEGIFTIKVPADVP